MAKNISGLPHSDERNSELASLKKELTLLHQISIVPHLVKFNDQVGMFRNLFQELQNEIEDRDTLKQFIEAFEIFQKDLSPAYLLFASGIKTVASLYEKSSILGLHKCSEII